MKALTLFTFGYLSSKSTRTMSELLALRIPLIDVRYQPRSNRFEWTQESLQGRCGALYMWIPELGNELYKEARTASPLDVRIKLHAPDAGIEKLQEILTEHRQGAIFCACVSKTACHRITVAALAKDSVPELKIVHL